MPRTTRTRVAPRSRFGVLGLLLLLVALVAGCSGGAPTAAPTTSTSIPAPTAAVPTPTANPTAPAPTPTPQASAAGPDWPPARFAGGQGDMTWTSECVIVDEGPFHLVGVGPQLAGEIEVTLGEYDAANLRYSGREVGTIVGPNNVVYDIDDGISFYYDLGTGNWLLEDFWIERVPLGAC
jgi:hypothetical protein